MVHPMQEPVKQPPPEGNTKTDAAKATPLAPARQRWELSEAEAAAIMSLFFM